MSVTVSDAGPDAGRDRAAGTAADHGGEVRISVRGEASIEVEPEVCEFAILLEIQDRDRRGALERLTQRNIETVDLIESFGEAVEKVETSGLTVHPVVDSKRRDEKVKAYAGAVRIRVVVGDFTVLGELVGRVADLGMTTVDGVAWRLRTDSTVYRDARTMAVKEAVTRAREYSAALGSTLSGLVEVADTGLSTSDSHQQFGGRAVFAASSRGLSSSDAAAPRPLDLRPVRQNVYASIEARFTATQPPPESLR